MRSGSATMSRTFRRGLSDEIGSWKIIWNRGRQRPQGVARRASRRARSVEHDRARRRLRQLERPPGRSSTSRSRTRRRGRASRHSAMSKLTSDTAWTTPPCAAGYSTTRCSTREERIAPVTAAGPSRYRPSFAPTGCQQAIAAGVVATGRRAAGARPAQRSVTAAGAARVEAAARAARPIMSAGRPGMTARRVPRGLVERGHRARAGPPCRACAVRRHERSGRRLLDDAAGVHHGDLVGEAGDDAEVVADEDHGHVPLVLECAQQSEDLRLDGDVEGGGRLVGDQQVGLARDGHGDGDALAHPAGQLVRVLPAGGAAARGCRPARAARRPGALAGGRDGSGSAGSPASACRSASPG